MKKWILVIAIVSVLSLVGFGVVLAQDTTPETPTYPGCPNCPFNGNGSEGSQVMHSYMISAMADALGITAEDFDAYRQSGLTFFEIANELNIDLDSLPELMEQAKTAAIENAYADGVLSQDQYDFFMERIGFGGHFDGMGFSGGFGGHHNGGFGQHHEGGFSGHHGGGMGNGSYGYQDCPYGQTTPSE